jgi:hypothetical protein
MTIGDKVKIISPIPLYVTPRADLFKVGMTGVITTRTPEEGALPQEVLDMMGAAYVAVDQLPNEQRPDKIWLLPEECMEVVA